MYKSIPLFIIGAVASAALANASDAAALHERVSGANCVYGSGGTNSNLITVGRAIFNTSSTEGEDLSCPVTDDDRFRKQDIVTVNIHGYNSGLLISGIQHRVEASTCVAFFGGTGGACTTPVTASGTGDYTLSPPTTHWTSANFADFGYIQVHLPPSGSPFSSVRGYFTTN
ncbi:hypothetical protein WME79_46135 [Sorangium sp. So ce726]|uniref:hypothetical protein n=1 Tax=Sorangium sp. So ce726 TaxID=3133319 RepID=UPI003F5E209C